MEVDETDPEIAWMDAEHARMQAFLRRAKRGLIEARAKDVERATSPLWRAHLQRELDKARAMWPELDQA